jgi:hypothetical protein
MRRFIISTLEYLARWAPVTLSNFISKSNYFISGYARFTAELFDKSSKSQKYRLPKMSRRLEGPSIACVVPVHNPKKKWLRMLLESIEVNHFDEVILVISGKNTLEIESLCLGYKVKNLICEIEPNMASIALKTNVAIETSKSDFVILLDHDDFLAPNTSEILRKYLSKNEDVDVLTTEFALVHSNEQNIVSALNTYELVKPVALDPIWFLQTNYIVHLVCMKRDLVLSKGLMNPEFDFSQDVELWLRLMSYGANFRHIQVATYGWRHHPKSVADGSQAKPEIIGRHKRAIEDFIYRKGYSGEAHEVVYRGRRTGNFRIASKVDLLDQTAITIGSCEYSEDLTSSSGARAPHGWLLVVSSCLAGKNIALDENLFSTIQHIEDSIGAVGLTIKSTIHDLAVYGEVPNESQKQWGWDLEDEGFFGRNICIHNCELLAAPAALVRREILSDLQNLDSVGCSDLGIVISALCRESNLKVLIDPISSIFVDDAWIESHGHLDFKALIKAGM